MTESLWYNVLMSAEQRPHVPESREDTLLNNRELRRSDPYIMQVSGLVVASDGVKRHSLLDVANTPFYGGSKILLKDKILNPNLILTDGMPLIEPVIKAMFDANSVNDFVIVGNEDQCEDLEEVASRNSNGKPYRVISNNGQHIGEVVALGADNVSLSGYLFIAMSDLPYANGQAVDFAVADILRGESIGADVYLPVVSADFFNSHGDGWTSTFSRLQKDGEKGKFRGLNFVIANSRNINPEAIKTYYEIRMIHSLKGMLNAVKHFPMLAPEVAIKHIIKYLTSRLSISDLEATGSELYDGELRVVEVFHPVYASFMKDIDTLRDYNAYRRKEVTNGTRNIRRKTKTSAVADA